MNLYIKNSGNKITDRLVDKVCNKQINYILWFLSLILYGSIIKALKVFPIILPTIFHT